MEGERPGCWSEAEARPGVAPARFGGSMEVVVDVKVTSTDKMNEAFKEKDEKYRV